MDEGYLSKMFPRSSQIPYQMHSRQQLFLLLFKLADELRAIRKNFGTKPSGAGLDLSKTTFYKCVKLGQLRPNCPDKTTTYPENFWQNIPPTDGKFSMTKDGRQWHWCNNKCHGGEGRWSTIHGTETQKGSPKTVTFTAAANLAGVDKESSAEDGVLMYNPAGFVASCYDHKFDWSSIATSTNPCDSLSFSNYFCNS